MVLAAPGSREFGDRSWPLVGAIHELTLAGGSFISMTKAELHVLVDALPDESIDATGVLLRPRALVTCVLRWRVEAECRRLLFATRRTPRSPRRTGSRFPLKTGVPSWGERDSAWFRLRS